MERVAEVFEQDRKLVEASGYDVEVVLSQLDLVEPLDLVAAKERWLSALAEAEDFVEVRPPDEVGCLYYSADLGRFVVPDIGRDLANEGLVPHFGREGGVLPRPADQRIDREE